MRADGDALTGTVHASAWPGDAAISDGKIDGNRVAFTMTGHLPFSTSSGGQVQHAGYPNLCFTGVRSGDEMKIELRWTEAGRTCEEGNLLPMAAKKVAD